MSPRPQPFVPKLNQAEEGTLKGQLIKLGMYTIAASFETEAERAAKDEMPYAAYLARLIELEMADKADRSVNALLASSPPQHRKGRVHARSRRRQDRS